MRSRRFLAAVVSLALAAGYASVPTFAENADSVSESTEQSANVTNGGDEVTSDGETTADNDLGDVNGDKVINITDVVKTSAHIKNIKPLDAKGRKAADVNFDGKINVTDLSLLAGHVKGNVNIKEYIAPPTVKEPRPKSDNVSLVEFNVNKDTGKVSWNAAEGMKQYVVTFSNGEKSGTVTTSATNAAIPYDMFKDGRLTVTIAPVRIAQTEDGTRVKDYGDSIGYLMKIKPDAMTGAITVTDTNGKALMKWDKADFASGYRIYDLDRTETDGMPHLLADTQSTEFTTEFPTDGKDRHLMIVPFNSNGESNGMTAKLSGTAVAPQPTPVDPTPVEPTPVDPTPSIDKTLAAPNFELYNYYYSDCNSATVFWYSVSGAEGYQVYTTVNGEKVEYFTTGTKFTLPNLTQGTQFDVAVRAYKTVNGQKVFGESATMKPITDALRSVAVKTPIYASPDIYSAQVSSLSTGNLVTQTDLPANGWVTVFIPGSGGQKGYVPMANLAKYANSLIGVINQDGWLGGDPAVLGCEETSLASVLRNQFGIDVSKNTLLNYYMPEQAFSNGTINVDPNYCFWGSPYHMEGSVGYGVYAPVIAQSAHQYLKYIGQRDDFSIRLNTDYYTGNNVNKLKFDPSKLDLGDTKISGGLDLNGLKAELDRGANPIVWYSEVNTYPVCTQVVNAGGKLTNPGTGTYNFTWYGRQHTAVLMGYDDSTGKFIIGNVENFDSSSYFGVTDYVDYDFFMSTYTTLGRQSVVLYKK
ncbi:dockerin type I domain-containing protein [Ruminococcus albus]|uniref:Dockerin type I repeat protein n=1 Tax=Ruminococcus albus 8 TaxID=246199 RepID=E9SB97_RUMAL|nr:dockerin type I domain-containing protein [Ruminococcus albus]EGC03432.1 dockerin type I repeat protein [Ruminococcus albus 8]MCC3350251.1 dockerin type I domain-containing protein [Ruminococcus albus 8]